MLVYHYNELEFRLILYVIEMRAFWIARKKHPTRESIFFSIWLGLHFTTLWLREVAKVPFHYQNLCTKHCFVQTPLWLSGSVIQSVTWWSFVKIYQTNLHSLAARKLIFFREGSPPPTCHMSCVTCHLSHASCVTCHMSKVTCRMSCVTCHMSHVTCHMSHVNKE